MATETSSAADASTGNIPSSPTDDAVLLYCEMSGLRACLTVRKTHHHSLEFTVPESDDWSVLAGPVQLVGLRRIIDAQLLAWAAAGSPGRDPR